VAAAELLEGQHEDVEEDPRRDGYGGLRVLWLLGGARIRSVARYAIRWHSGAMNVFDTAIERIQVAYQRLGHELGWRFLATPRRTLDAQTRLAFIGMNPGGSRYEPPVPSVESGNAYRLERWGPGGTLNPLQIQVGHLYEALAAPMGSSAEALMDESLAAHFCPFRSPSWDGLHNQRESIEFSRRLWRAILDEIHPPVLICMGSAASRELQQILLANGARLASAPRAIPINWGSLTATLNEYKANGTRSLVVSIPHLSRFRFFGRAASASAGKRDLR
jgi:hypothetical protein